MVGSTVTVLATDTAFSAVWLPKYPESPTGTWNFDTGAFGDGCGRSRAACLAGLLFDALSLSAIVSFGVWALFRSCWVNGFGAPLGVAEKMSDRGYGRVPGLAKLLLDP